MSLRVSDKELYDLSGYMQPARQIKWLRKHGVRFFVSADGHPRVLRSDLEPSSHQRRNLPNYSAIQRKG